MSMSLQRTSTQGDPMATNPKAVELAKQGKVEYEWGTLWPHYHKEKMNWGGGFRTKGDVDILFLSGETGRDPFEDAPCRTPEEERAGRGKVMSHDVKEQTRQCLEYIKNKLEMMGASLKHIVMFRYYLPRREDVFDMRDEMYRFFEEFEPDLRENPRNATLLRGVGIDGDEVIGIKLLRLEWRGDAAVLLEHLDRFLPILFRHPAERLSFGVR